MAAVVTSIVFRRFICKSWQKLAFLALCLLLSGGFGLLVPLISSFPLLLPALLGAGFFIGSYNTANNSLVVYMLGPDKCPPYIQSLHAFTSAGFVLSSLVVRPFFPEVNVDAICELSDVEEALDERDSLRSKRLWMKERSSTLAGRTSSFQQLTSFLPLVSSSLLLAALSCLSSTRTS